MKSIEVCREIAARIWCDQECGELIMDVDFAEGIAWMLFSKFKEQEYARGTDKGIESKSGTPECDSPQLRSAVDLLQERGNNSGK